MNPPHSQQSPIPERMAVVEVELQGLNIALNGVRHKQDHQEATLNTISVNLATLTQSVKGLTAERAIWKNPLIYISFLSVAVAAITLLK